MPYTGLYYYNARYYDPEIGRFIQPDTIIPDPGDSQAYNRYAYCRNNPVMHTDPSGHSWISDAVDSVCDTVSDAIDDVADWVDDNIIEEGRDFVQNNRFVQDAMVFGAFGGAVSGLLWASTVSFNEVRPYVGVAVGAVVSVVMTIGTVNPAAGGAIGGAASGFVSAYLAGGTIREIAKATALGAAVGAITGGITMGASSAVAQSILANAFARGVLAGALSGAVSGGAYAAAYGGNVGETMWKGAVVGGASAGAGYAIGGHAAGIVSGMVSGGLSGALNDGDIVKGMLKGAAIAAATAMVAGLIPGMQQTVSKSFPATSSRRPKLIYTLGDILDYGISARDLLIRTKGIRAWYRLCQQYQNPNAPYDGLVAIRPDNWPPKYEDMNRHPLSPVIFSDQIPEMIDKLNGTLGHLVNPTMALPQTVEQAIVETILNATP